MGGSKSGEKRKSSDKTENKSKHLDLISVAHYLMKDTGVKWQFKVLKRCLFKEECAVD